MGKESSFTSFRLCSVLAAGLERAGGGWVGGVIEIFIVIMSVIAAHELGGHEALMTVGNVCRATARKRLMLVFFNK